MRTWFCDQPILDDGPAAPPSNAISLRTAILSLPRQERLGLPYLLPLGIRVLGEVYQLAKILRGLRSVAHRIGRACGTPESAVAVGCVLERGLIFLQRRRGLADFQQQLGQHLAQRIEAGFHDHVFYASVLPLPGPPPEHPPPG